MAIALVQTASSTLATASTAVVTFLSASTVGDIAVIALFWDGANTVSSLADNGSTPNTYTLVGTTTAGSGGQARTTSVYEGAITHLPSVGNLIFTATWNASTPNVEAVATEYSGQSSGLVLIDPLSQVADNEGAGTPANYQRAINYTGSVLYCAAYSTTTTNLAPASGFTQRFVNTTGQIVVDSIGTNFPASAYYLSPITNLTTNKYAIVIFALVAATSTLVGINPPSSGDLVFRGAKGIFQLDTGGDSDPTTFAGWTNPTLSGISYRGHWATIEPSPGVYNWAEFDAVAALAAQYGKYYALALSCGKHSPPWLISQLGAQPYTLNTGTPQQITVPAPWDPQVVAQRNALTAIMGARYGADPRLAYTPIGTGAGDMEAFVAQNAMDLAELNAMGGIGIWINATYLTIAAYATAFRRTPLVFVTGQPVPNDTTTIQTMVTYLCAQYGAQFGFRSSGLDASRIPSPYFFQFGPSNPCGFQMTSDFHTSPIPWLNNANAVSNGLLALYNQTQNNVPLPVAFGGPGVFEIYTLNANDPNSNNANMLWASIIFGPGTGTLPKITNPLHMSPGESGGNKRAFPFNHK